MCMHVWRRVAGTGLFDRVFVATDDPRIEAAVAAHDGEAVLTGTALSGTHRVAMVAAEVGSTVVVNVQGDLPLISIDAIEMAVSGLARARIGTVSAPLVGDRDNPALVKVEVDGEGIATRFSRRAFSDDAQQHVGVYAFTAGALDRASTAPVSERSHAEGLEQLAWMDAGLSIAVGRIASAPSAIDTGEQLEALRSRFDAGHAGVPDPPDPRVYSAAGLR